MAEDFESTSPEGQAEAAGKAIGEAFRPAEPAPDEVPNALPSDAAETDDGEVGLYERARLNQTESYYRGTLRGAGTLAGMAHLISAPDDNMSPEMKRMRATTQKEYDAIVADLARYDMLRPWGSTVEAAASLGGQLSGGVQSPEAFIGVPAKGATVLGRIVKAGFQQGAIQAAVDLIVQYLNNEAGTEQGYDPIRTAIAGGLGVIVGGGLHGVGELVSAAAVRKLRGELAKEDEAFAGDLERALAHEEPVPDRLPSDVAEEAEAAAKPAEAAARPAREREEYIITDPLAARTDGETMNVQVLRDKDGRIEALYTDDLGVTKVGPAYRDLSAEEAIAHTLGDHLQGAPPDVSKVKRIEPESTEAKPAESAPGEEVQAAMPEGVDALAARRGGGVLPMQRARPDQGTPSTTTTPTGTAVATVPQGPSPAQQSAIKSLQQQAMDFAEAIGFPLRQGRQKIKTALGEYSPGTGVVRVREVPDFEVVAHEGGHAIEKKVGTDLTNLTQQFSSELAPLVSNPAAYKPSQYVKEGFAEYIRRYIGNPAHAQQVAPGFTTAFRNFMEMREPEMMKAIDAAAQAYQSYLRAPSVDVVASVMRSMNEDPEGWKGVVKDIRERGFPATIGTMVKNAYTKLLDDKAPIARAVFELSKAIRDQNPNHALVNLKAADNPEALLRLAGRSQQAAIHDMMDGTYGYHHTTPDGPSLTDALTLATGEPTKFGKWDEGKRTLFSNYLIARRAEVLWGKFERGELANPPVSFSKGDAQVALAELERANPAFRQASDMVHAYSRKQLMKAFDGGLIDADLVNRLMGEEFYVPFMRDLSDRPLAQSGPGGGGGAEGPGMTAIVKKIKGSSRDIMDPIQSMMMQTFLLNRTLAHNDIIKSFVRLSEQAGAAGGRYVEKIPAHEAKKYTFDLMQSVERLAREKGTPPDEAKALAGMLTDVFGEDPLVGSFFRQEAAGKRGEPIVFYKDGGELKAVRFMSEKEGHALYETLTALPHKMTDVFSELVSVSAAVMRAGITSSPTFAITNYIRDQVAASILRSDYVPFISGLKGIKAEFAQGEAAKLYAKGGGVAPGSSIAMVERAVEADVNALAKKGYLVNRLTSFKGLMDLAAFTEAGTRNSVFDTVFKAKRAQGLSDYEAMIEAAYQATDLLDFSRHGAKTLFVRNYLPFLNAHMQGLDKAYRTMVQPIVDKIRGNQVFASDTANFNNAMMAWVKTAGVGTVLGAGWAAVHSDSEAYRDASPYLKGTHLVIPFGNKVFLVPKPFELGIGFTLGEYAYQMLAQHDQRAAATFASAAWQALEPPNPFGDIPIIKQFAEIKTGKSMFTGNDIVPERLQRLPAAQQYTDRTSSLAKALGKLINVSPMKIDNAVGNQFGNWGRDIMALSAAFDPKAPAANWEDYVFARRFIKDPGRTSDVTTKYWGFLSQTTGTYNQDVNGYDNLVRLRDDAGAEKFLSNLPPRERAFVVMKSAADEDGKAIFKADEKRLHPLQRSYDAVTLLNQLSRDLIDNNVSTWENRTPLELSKTMRRDLLDSVRELKQMEMRNAFVIMKEPGYEGRPLLDTGHVFDKIMAISPQVGEEIATRYATQKIYTTKAVAAAYPDMERALLRDGSDADIGSLAYDAKAEGYEFGGDKAKKPNKRRIHIAPTAPAPATLQ